MNCEICGSKLKPLFTSNYCPNEDKHHLKKEEPFITKEAFEKLFKVLESYHFVFAPITPVTYLTLFPSKPSDGLENPLSDGKWYPPNEITYDKHAKVTVEKQKDTNLWKTIEEKAIESAVMSIAAEEDRRILKLLESRAAETQTITFTRVTPATVKGQDVEQQTETENLQLQSEISWKSQI